MVVRSAADRRWTGADHTTNPSDAAAVDMTTDWGANRALYGISVASELTGVNPQTLRAYESRGLLEPHRTQGGTRRYSDSDLDRVSQIATLLAAGLNLAGVERVLALQAETDRLRDQIAGLRGHQENR